MLRERWKEDCRRDKPGQGGRAVRPALGGYMPACFDRDGLCIVSTWLWQLLCASFLYSTTSGVYSNMKLYKAVLVATCTRVEWRVFLPTANSRP